MNAADAPASTGPDAFQIITLVIAVAGFLLALLTAWIQWRTYRRDRAEIKVEASWGFVTYGAGLGPTVVIATATNTGRHPIALTGLALGVAGPTVRDASVPFMDHMDGSRLPAVLQPGQYAQMSMEADPLAATLRERQARIVSVVANGPSGKWTNSRVANIATLGQPEG